MLILAAIAVPAILAAEQASNENAAVQDMRTIVTAESSFRQLSGGYSADGASLGGAVAAGGCPEVPTITAGTAPAGASGSGCFLPDAVAAQLNGGTISGFTFAYAGTDADHWTLTATPATPSKGRKAYFTDQTGIVRYIAKGDGTKADVSAKPLGQ